MRAFSVVVVVLFHAGVPWLAGGYVAVDVFFVLSGYLITSQLVGELARTGRVSLLGFYARRARRLLPLAGFVTVVTVVASWLLTSSLAARETSVDALWSAAFVMNMRLAWEGVDYGANEDPSPFQHFWSLAIEEQFYLAWPLLIVAASLLWWRRARAARALRGGGAGGARGAGSGGAIAKGAGRSRRGSGAAAGTGGVVGGPVLSRVGLSVAIGVVVLASFAYGVHQTAAAQSLAYFVTPARAWELAAGALIAVNATWLAKQRWLQTGWLAWPGMALIITGVLAFDEQTAFPGWWALFPVIGTSAIIIAGLSRATSLERGILSALPLQGLGRISYGLYLWHWPLLILAPAYYNTDQLSLWQTTVVVVLSVWLSTISFYVIEDPLRTNPVLKRLPWRSLLVGAATVGLSATVAFTAFTAIPDPRGTGSYAEPVSELSELPAAITAARGLADVPSNLDPSVSEAATDKPSPTTGDGSSCMVDLLDTSLSRDGKGSCVFGEPGGDVTVVLTGDSHAYQWLPAIEAIALDRGWRLVNLTKSGCPLYDVEVVNTMLNRDYVECYEWRSKVHDRVRAEQPDLVVTSAFIGSKNRDDTFTARWVAGVEATVTELRSVGTEVMVLNDTPYPQVNVPECLAENLESAAECHVPATVALSDPSRREAAAVAAAEAGATVVDPTDWFCDAQSCPAIVGNTVVYSDISHVTATYSRLLGPNLERELVAAGVS